MLDNGHEKEEKLQKVLARMGLASRRAVEEYILDERVEVNGAIAHIGQRVNIQTDELHFDGTPLRVKPELVYYLLHKPCLLYTSPSPRDGLLSRMPSSA